jgi:hypothetical protein
MGDITRTLFGGSKQKSSSDNQAFGTINSALAPTLGFVKAGGQGAQDLLSGNSSGFDAFKRAIGFDAMAERGSRGVTNNAAAGGLLRSGSSGMALQRYGQELQNETASDYLSQLFSLAGLGNQSAGVLSNAGQRSSSSGNTSSGGLGKALGKAASAAMMSDPRLKYDVTKLFELDDGLGVYEWTYIWEPEGTFNLGVMADEVAELRPWALGPEVEGFMTVIYEAL